MKKEDGEIVCDRCGLSLGKYKTTAEKHYCTSHSFSMGDSRGGVSFAGNNSNYMG